MRHSSGVKQSKVWTIAPTRVHVRTKCTACDRVDAEVDLTDAMDRRSHLDDRERPNG